MRLGSLDSLWQTRRGFIGLGCRDHNLRNGRCSYAYSTIHPLSWSGSRPRWWSGSIESGTCKVLRDTTDLGDTAASRHTWDRILHSFSAQDTLTRPNGQIPYGSWADKAPGRLVTEWYARLDATLTDSLNKLKGLYRYIYVW